MSVVNKMLQDLESRQSQQQVPSADYDAPKKSNMPMLILLVLIIVFIAAAGYWWFVEKQKMAGVQNSPIDVSSLPLPSNKSVVEKAHKEVAPSEPLATEMVKIEQPKAEQPKVEQAIVAQQTPDTSEELVQTQVIQQTSPDLRKVSSFEINTSNSSDSTESLKQQIHVAIQLKDDPKTISLLKKLIDKDPTNPIATKKLAAMLFAQGKITESKQVILDGIALYPDTTELRMMLARLYVQQKNLLEAHNTLSELFVGASTDPNYVSFRASLAKRLELYDQAKTDYQNLLASQPSNAKWWLGLAVAEEKLGNQSFALIAYRKVNELNQLSAEVGTFVQQRINYLAGVL